MPHSCDAHESSRKSQEIIPENERALLDVLDGFVYNINSGFVYLIQWISWRRYSEWRSTVEHLRENCADAAGLRAVHGMRIPTTLKG